MVMATGVAAAAVWLRVIVQLVEVELGEAIAVGVQLNPVTKTEIVKVRFWVTAYPLADNVTLFVTEGSAAEFRVNVAELDPGATTTVDGEVSRVELLASVYVWLAAAVPVKFKAQFAVPALLII